MNILMFNYEYPPLGGGGGVIHRQVAEELARRHRVVVVTSRYGDLPAHEMVANVEVFRVRVVGRTSLTTGSLLSLLSYYPASLRKGLDLAAQRRFDVVGSHFAVPTGPSAVRVARERHLPHLLSIHGGDIYDPSKPLSPHRLPLVRPTVRRVLQQVDQVTAPSRNTAQNARRFYGFTGPIEIIPHGVRWPPRSSASRDTLGLPPNAHLLVTVGRLVKRKQVDQLLRIVAGLRDPQVRLVIIGDGPERPALEQLAHSLGVAAQVMFAGRVSEERKFQLLQAADVFVATTQHEGFGLMYLEAMYCGLPIVTYDHGGQSDFLVDGRTGFQVPVDAQDLFAQRVALLLRDSDLRQRTGQHNHVATQDFSVEVCAARYERLLQNLTATAGATGTGVPVAESAARRRVVS